MLDVYAIITLLEQVRALSSREVESSAKQNKNIKRVEVETQAAWTRNFTLVGIKKRATVEQEKEELKSKMK